MWKEFLDWIFKKKKETQVITRRVIARKELNIKARFLDNFYQLPSFDEVYNFIKIDNISFKEFKKEYFDCDDFSVILWGRLREQFQGCAIGFALSNTHAFNVFIDNNLKLWIIEPQTDKIFAPNNTSKYKIKTLII